jgi:hypothetical protein
MTEPQRHKPRPRTRKQFNTASLAIALERKFPQEKNAYSILYEVSDSTGFGGGGYCDAFVMSTWPSRGLHLSGFEFKASRSDWLKEVADPAKSERFSRYCDYWWLAVTDESIVRLDQNELPATWGLMALDARGSLRVIRDAPRNKTPEPIDRAFLAAMLRRVTEPVVAQVTLISYGEREAIRREAEEKAGRKENELREELSELCRKVTAFENASGCTIDNRYAWRGVPPDRMGSALRFITDGGLGEYVSSFGGIVEQLETRINHLRGVLDTAKKFATPPQLHEPPPLAPSSAPVTNSTESPHVT